MLFRADVVVAAATVVTVTEKMMVMLLPCMKIELSRSSLSMGDQS